MVADTEDELYTVKEVASILKISRKKVLRLMRDGWITYVHVGRDHRVHRDVLLKIVRSGTGTIGDK